MISMTVVTWQKQHKHSTARVTYVCVQPHMHCARVTYMYVRTHTCTARGVWICTLLVISTEHTYTTYWESVAEHTAIYMTLYTIMLSRPCLINYSWHQIQGSPRTEKQVLYSWGGREYIVYSYCVCVCVYYFSVSVDPLKWLVAVLLVDYLQSSSSGVGWL